MTPIFCEGPTFLSEMNITVIIDVNEPKLFKKRSGFLANASYKLSHKTLSRLSVLFRKAGRPFSPPRTIRKLIDAQKPLPRVLRDVKSALRKSLAEIESKASSPGSKYSPGASVRYLVLFKYKFIRTRILNFNGKIRFK